MTSLACLLSFLPPTLRGGEVGEEGLGTREARRLF